MRRGFLKRTTNNLLGRIGQKLVSLQELEAHKREIVACMEEIRPYREISLPSLVSAIQFYVHASESEKRIIEPYLLFSKSQLAQDLFAMASNDSLDPKFFVEFGAADGVFDSNTYLLEKHLGWNGILIEPARIWHSRLAAERTCIIDHRCISSSSGGMCDFVEVFKSDSVDYSGPELSSLASFARNGDWASTIRMQSSTTYQVPTVTLDDVLDEYSAPKKIEFMSIDTEGSELDILSSFSFNRTINTICVEHNYKSAQRLGLFELLSSKGYKRVYEEASKWDDWYVLAA